MSIVFLIVVLAHCVAGKLLIIGFCIFEDIWPCFSFIYRFVVLD